MDGHWRRITPSLKYKKGSEVPVKKVPHVNANPRLFIRGTRSFGDESRPPWRGSSLPLLGYWLDVYMGLLWNVGYRFRVSGLRADRSEHRRVLLVLDSVQVMLWLY